MNYSGEHITPGLAGHYSLIISLIISFIAALLFLFAKNRAIVYKAAKYLFTLHTLLIATACISLLYIIFNHYFEYNYVWQYSSLELPASYLLSSFWAGKEGSILIWLFFQAIFGFAAMFILQQKGNKAMAVIGFTQFAFGLLISGLWPEAGLLKNPFVLLREIPEYSHMPLFNSPEYVSYLTNGNGLNPLLRNPWMAIHPPILFSGYAACLIPYSIGITGLNSNNRFRKISTVSILISIFLLGAGLILGGAWAYEDLTFGGFWSWDPVENASFVPWLLLIVSLHLIITFPKRKATLIFTAMPYVFVLFAAYLTRSGVLQNVSAHSFSGGQGSAYILFLTFMYLLMIFPCLKYKNEQNETLITFSSKYTILTGVIIVALAAFQIISATSIPAINSWFGFSITPPPDPVKYYNTWQSIFFIPAGILIAISLYLKTTKTGFFNLIKNITLPLIISLSISIFLIIFYQFSNIITSLLLFSAIFIVICIIDSFLRFKIREINIAANISHLGLGIFITGIILAFYLSSSIIPGNNDDDQTKTQYLLLGEIVPLNNYYVSYAGRTINDDVIKYKLDFLKKEENGKFYLIHSMYPSLIENKNTGNIYLPSTHHTLTKDIFVHLVHAEITTDERIPLKINNDSTETKLYIDKTDYIIIKGRSFPFINLLWGGSIIMAAGLIISIIKRISLLY